MGVACHAPQGDQKWSEISVHFFGVKSYSMQKEFWKNAQLKFLTKIGLTLSRPPLRVTKNARNYLLIFLGYKLFDAEEFFK